MDGAPARRTLRRQPGRTGRRQGVVWTKHLDAVASGVDHNNRPAWAKVYIVGAKELAGARTERPELECERAVGAEHLDAVVSRVGHGNDPAWAKGGAAGGMKLAGARTERPELECERAVGAEHLDAVVSRVGHGNDPAGAKGGAAGGMKLAVGQPGTERKGKRNIHGSRIRRRVEHLDAAVEIIGHCNCSVGAEGDAGRPTKPPSGPQLEGERAVGVEHLDAAVISVGHGDDPAGAEVDALGGSKLAGGLPLRSELERERAVGVEHLDAVV